jgi:hypothetical protein
MPLGLWGAADQAMTLSLEVLRLLSQALGVRSPGRPAPDLAELRLSDPKLPEAVRDRLVAALGNKHVRDDPQARALHTRGKSRLDLLRLRAGEADDAPDLVLLPGSRSRTDPASGSASCRALSSTCPTGSWVAMSWSSRCGRARLSRPETSPAAPATA